MRCSDCMSDVCASDLTNCPEQYVGAHAAGRQVERTDQGGVDHDEPAAWIVVRRGPFGPSPSSQQTAEPEAPRTKSFRPAELDKQIGRGTVRERVCTNVWPSGDAVSVQKKKNRP